MGSLEYKDQVYRAKRMIGVIPKKVRMVTPVDLVAETYLQMDASVDYDIEAFCVLMVRVLSRLQCEGIRRDISLYHWCNENSKKWQKANSGRCLQHQKKYHDNTCKLLTDAYCIRAMRHKYSLNFIKANPSLIEETRNRILNKRAKHLVA